MKKPRGRIGEASHPGPRIDHRSAPSLERPTKVKLSSVAPCLELVEKRSRAKDDAPVAKQEKVSGSGGQGKIEIEDEQPGVKREGKILDRRSRGFRSGQRQGAEK